MEEISSGEVRSSAPMSGDDDFPVSEACRRAGGEAPKRGRVHRTVEPGKPAPGFTSASECRDTLREILSRPGVSKLLADRKLALGESDAATRDAASADEGEGAREFEAALQARRRAMHGERPSLTEVAAVDAPGDREAAGAGAEGAAGAGAATAGAEPVEVRVAEGPEARSQTRLLWEACLGEDLGAAEAALLAGADPNRPDPDMHASTAVHMAASVGHCAILRRLQRCSLRPAPTGSNSAHPSATEGPRRASRVRAGAAGSWRRGTRRGTRRCTLRRQAASSTPRRRCWPSARGARPAGLARGPGALCCSGVGCLGERLRQGRAPPPSDGLSVVAARRPTLANEYGQNPADMAEAEGHLHLAKTLEEHLQVLLTRRRYTSQEDAQAIQVPTEEESMQRTLRMLEVEEERSQLRARTRGKVLVPTMPPFALLQGVSPFPLLVT